jgi:hypothetical protein
MAATVSSQEMRIQFAEKVQLATRAGKPNLTRTGGASR